MTKNTPLPPFAPRHPHVKRVHNQRLRDDYDWLRNKQSPEVLAYLNEREARKDRASAQEKASGVPYKDGEYFYHSRTRKGQQYRIYCRKRGSLSAREEVVLDLNRMATGKPYIALGALEVSGNGGMPAGLLINLAAHH